MRKYDVQYVGIVTLITALASVTTGVFSEADWSIFLNPNSKDPVPAHHILWLKIKMLSQSAA